MALRRIANHWLAAAIEQAKIPRTLEQAEKMLGRVVGFVDAQHAAFIDLAQQAFHALQHPLWPGFEEDQREFRVLATQGHHQTVQVHRFVAVDQLVEPARDVQQHGLHGDTFR